MLRALLCGLVAVAMLATAAPAAPACTVDRPLDIADIEKAMLVVRGRVVEYRRLAPADAQTAERNALIRIEVAETWRGSERDEWQILWGSESSELPEDWPFGDDIVLAALMPVALQTLPAPGDGASREPEPLLPWVLQAPCAPPFIFRTTPPEDEERRHDEEMEGVRNLMKQMPSESMRRRMEGMLGESPEKTYRRRIAALRACVEEDMEICKAVWRNP